MSSIDHQTKDAYMEALLELLEKFYEKMKGNMKKEEGNELSQEAKEIAEELKKNPELAKDLLKQYAIEQIEGNATKYLELDTKIHNEIQIKKSELDPLNPIENNRINLLEDVDNSFSKQREVILNELNDILNTAKEQPGKFSVEGIEDLVQRYEDLDQKIKHTLNSLVQDKIEDLKTERPNENKLMNKESQFDNEDEKTNLKIEEKIKQNVYIENPINEKTKTLGNVILEESKFIESDIIRPDNKTNWVLENTIKEIEVKSKSGNLSIPEKLEALQDKGVNISKLHSRKSIDIAFEKMLEIEEFENGKSTKSNKLELQKESNKIEIER